MKIKLLFFSICLVLSGCSKVNQENPNTVLSIQNLKGETPKKVNQQNSKLKLDTIKEVALSYSAQVALKITSESIQEKLLKQEEHLNTIFNFAPLMIEKNVIAPVIISSLDTANVSIDKQSVRTANITYEILKPAKFVSNLPNWRSTLLIKYKMPDLPPKSMLPTNKRENEVWVKAVKEGWELGKKQAYSIFKNNLHRLTRDINGMILFKKLNLLNIVSKPYVGQRNLGIQFNDNQIRINDNIDKITAVAEIIENENLWEPVIITHS
jgi:defect-in-organelle-trafficking protein DotC